MNLVPCQKQLECHQHMVSWSWMLVKSLVISQETRYFLERFAFLIWETKEKVSLQE